jgi:hypothetical protein
VLEEELDVDWLLDAAEELDVDWMLDVVEVDDRPGVEFPDITEPEIIIVLACVLLIAEAIREMQLPVMFIVHAETELTIAVPPVPIVPPNTFPNMFKIHDELA